MSNPVFLYKIKPLRREMIANEQVAITFDYSNNNVLFFIIFYNLEQMILTFVKKGTTDHFSVVVGNDFSINTILENDDYSALTDMLGLTYQKGSPFRPFNFFLDFSQKIPPHSAARPVDAKKNISYIAKYIEEAEKTEFIDFHPHGKGKGHVSEENLNKTALYFGIREAARCKKANVSSRWRPPQNK